MSLVELKEITKTFPIPTGAFSKPASLQAIRGVSLSLEKGETVGLVGESGCGKSTLGRCLLRLIEPTSGQVFFRGEEITHAPKEKMISLRRKMQIIFQDPYSSLNPRMTVGSILEEPLLIHRLTDGRTATEKRIHELLELVGLPREAEMRYPHEFSGGQRQRIGIARALAVEPEFIVCDEPVSALDISVQAQIINLLKDLQSQLGLTYLFISHDLRVVEHLCRKVAVMYLGKIVEFADSETIFETPLHPYTRALLSAVPRIHQTDRKERQVLAGEPPSAMRPPEGCAFHPRCPLVEPKCRESIPNLELGGEKRRAACWVTTRPGA